jgi:hypothetical protein
MKQSFYRLNEGWNAEPNAPNPAVEVQGHDIILRFLVNPFQSPEFRRGEFGILRFVKCSRYRLGAPNDEGWYLGQRRFSKIAPRWGEFYLVQGNDELLQAPDDWRFVAPTGCTTRHFLFYFRDDTFECDAAKCIFEISEENSLLRVGSRLALVPENLTERGR